MIAIIDYGMGNIHSVQKALEFCGAKTRVTNKPADIHNADKVILPGVGAFADAMDELKRNGLIEVLAEYTKNKKPFLGICLGMQLLFEGSDEAEDSKGLAVLKGRVKLFDKKMGLKVPHMGWNQLKKAADKCPLLKDIAEGSYVYFCHSYYPKPNDTKVVTAKTDYGIGFVSMVWRDNIYGVQFHPEKSQNIGLKIIKNFVDL